jgi:tetratricopeptide (TPR) repeat protein
VQLKYLLKIGLLAIAAVFCGSGPLAAQDNKPATIKVSPDEAKAIKKIEEGKTLADKIKATSDFLKKYPKSPVRSQAAGYLAGQITQSKDDAAIVQSGEAYLTIFTEDAETDLIWPNLIFSYGATGRDKEAFAAAEKYLARHPEDVSTRLRLAIQGSNKLRAGTKDYAAPSRAYAVQAIELIEANKKPADLDDAGWKEYQTKWLPQLYQSVGSIDFQAGDKEKARASFEKAVKLDAADVNSWLLLANMENDQYQAAALKYNAASAGAERDELLKQANEKMDRVIEMYARIVALTDGRAEAKPINDQVRQDLENYYKYRHKNTDGLQELINKYKK